MYTLLFGLRLQSYPSLWLVFRTRHGSQIWCMLTKITKTRWEPGKKNPIAPLPRSSSLLTLPQGSLATIYHVVTSRSSHGMVSKSWLNHTSDYDSNAIVVIFFEKSKIFQRKKLGNPGTKSTILVVQTASEPVIPLPRVLKAAKAGPAPRVNLVALTVMPYIILGI